MHGGNGLKFCMLMYLDNLQNCNDHGHSLLIFLILALFWLSETGQIWGLRVLSGERLGVNVEGGGGIFPTLCIQFCLVVFISLVASHKQFANPVHTFYMHINRIPINCLFIHIWQIVYSSLNVLAAFENRHLSLLSNNLHVPLYIPYLSFGKSTGKDPAGRISVFGEFRCETGQLPWLIWICELRYFSCPLLRQLRVLKTTP